MQSFALWQQATIEFTCHDHSSRMLVVTFHRSHARIIRDYMPRSLYYCFFAPDICMVLFFTHIPFVVNHTINATPPERLQHLFAVYLDEFSIQLGSARVGCTVGNMVVNHRKFADEICVFSPSISGLQCLLNICGDYAAEHEISFNCNKTIGVIFCPKKYKQPAPSNVFLNGARVQFSN